MTALHEIQVLSLLKRRDAREKQFNLFINENQALARRRHQQAVHISSLEKSLSLLQLENAGTVRELKTAQDNGSPVSQKRIQELESTVSSLKDERSELYKTQGQNAQRLLEINDVIKQKEELEKKHIEEIQKQSATIQALSSKVESLTHNLSQKDVTIQVLQDENSTLQLEITKTEERNRDMARENGVLLDRWLKKMNDEAEKMNEANKFYESVVESSLRAAEIASQPTQDLQTPDAKIQERRSRSVSSVTQPLPATTAAVSTSESAAAPVMSRLGATASSASAYLGNVVERLSPKGRFTMQSAPTSTKAVPLKSRSSQLELDAVVLPNMVGWKNKEGNEGEICAVQASMDGNQIATGGSDKKVRLFDASNGLVKTVLTGPTQSIMSVAFNITGEMVLAASCDNSTRIWNLNTSRLWHTLTGHIGKVLSAKFSGDSTKVISGSHDRTVKVWDLQKGYCVRTIFSFSSCNDVCLANDDGSTVLSAHVDNSVRVWDVRSGNCTQEITEIHQGQVTSLDIAIDGYTVLTNSRDNTLRLLDLRNYGTLRVLSNDGYRVGMNWSRACFSPDGQHAAAGSLDGKVFIWNTLTGSLERTLKKGHVGAVCGVNWSKQGVCSADKDRTVCVWVGE